MKSRVREHLGNLGRNGRKTKVISEYQEIGREKQTMPDDIHFSLRSIV
jgi:hypothetical protein